MQNDPEKTFGNYNEFRGIKPPGGLLGDIVALQIEGPEPGEQQAIIEAGLRLVNSKVDDILGANNRLTRGDLVLPKTKFIGTYPEQPTWAGYFCSYENEIAIITGNTKDRLSRTKVYIHEYIHFLSHNGRDDGEQINNGSPIAVNNNVGFRRHFGLDIRKGKEGENTSDYFLAFNEAVTEQLAIDILPGVHETYDDYRGLLNQVIDDVTTQRLGSKNKDGIFQPWSREQVKSYIYSCFFRGDLGGFTQLLQTTYRKYDISEQQFGLMTHKDDLPSVIENRWIHDHPDNPPPPTQVAAMVQERLNNKTPADYATDIIDPEPGDDNSESQLQYGAEYDTHVREIVLSRTETIRGKEYDIDNLGYVVYHGEESSSMFAQIRAELDDLLIKAGSEDIDAKAITERIDQLLFHICCASMLSDGFRDFYIYKRLKLGN